MLQRLCRARRQRSTVTPRHRKSGWRTAILRHPQPVSLVPKRCPSKSRTDRRAQRAVPLLPHLQRHRRGGRVASDPGKLVRPPQRYQTRSSDRPAAGPAAARAAVDQPVRRVITLFRRSSSNAIAVLRSTVITGFAAPRKRGGVAMTCGLLAAEPTRGFSRVGRRAWTAATRRVIATGQAFGNFAACRVDARARIVRMPI